MHTERGRALRKQHRCGDSNVNKNKTHLRVFHKKTLEGREKNHVDHVPCQSRCKDVTIISQAKSPQNSRDRTTMAVSTGKDRPGKSSRMLGRTRKEASQPAGLFPRIFLNITYPKRKTL